MLGKWFWNIHALCYDSLTWLVPCQQMVADVVSTLNLTPGIHNPDIGCGTGHPETAIGATGVPVEVETVGFSLANALVELQGQRAGHRHHSASDFQALVYGPITRTIDTNQNWLLY